MMEIWERREARFQSRTSTPSTRTCPATGVVGAVDQFHQGGLAGAGLTDDGDGLAGFDLEGNVLQDRLAGRIGKGDIAEFDLAAHGVGIPEGILVEVVLAD